MVCLVHIWWGRVFVALPWRERDKCATSVPQACLPHVRMAHKHPCALVAHDSYIFVMFFLGVPLALWW